MGLLDGKRALIIGVANDHSLAWGIAKAFHREGARLAFSYGAENLERRVGPLAETLGVEVVKRCDVGNDREIAALFERLGQTWDQLDILVHSVAFAQRDDLKNRFIDTTRSGFQLALDVSAYSLIGLARAAETMMAPSGAMLTLTYYGSEKVLPGYNVMGVAKAALEASVRYLAWELGERGVRVNAISAGPVRTLSSAAVSGFREMLHHHAERSPLRRNITTTEVADTAVFLCSDHAAGITAEIVHVDAGYNVVGA
ncbi:MAG TPA: enoyl-ACP reductase [Terriglobales bacterium]|nr:enoyl-ACP reductase [Terriglobales bacterium]